MNRGLGELTVRNPKRGRSAGIDRTSWYPYYAGFSIDFAENLMSTAGLRSGASICDPWNGSGTTTSAAAACGFECWGFDLNPAMVVVSKARLLSVREKPSLIPIAHDIVAKSKVISWQDGGAEPLFSWFMPAAASVIRSIEASLQKLLVDTVEARYLVDANRVDGLSGLAAFFYTALFRTVRTLLRRFVASNPTWIKTPESGRSRLKPGKQHIRDLFLAEVTSMVQSMDARPNEGTSDSKATLAVATSEAMPLVEHSIDFVLSSPPYCTRLDYAVASRPELALMGYSEQDFSSLRRRLMGTSTVPKEVPEMDGSWGPTCCQFLEKVQCHYSKASSGYYYKNHVQYFASVWNSMVEISRVLKLGGKCILVVQDSYYKDQHNDLATIFIEMAERQSVKVVDRFDFQVPQTLAGINPAVRAYRPLGSAVESVLCFEKT